MSLIIVDNRVGAVEISPKLRDSGITVSITKLSFGDFCFPGKGPKGSVLIGIERKTVSDLINSMQTGRLSGHQLIGMLRTYNFTYLLIEGVIRANPKSGVAEVPRGRKWFPAGRGSRVLLKSDLDNYLHTLSIMTGIFVWFVPSTHAGVRWIQSVYRWWQKDWDKHKSHRQFHRHFGQFSLVKPPITVRVASEFKGVGGAKAAAFGKTFRSVHALVNASPESLAETEGIGKKLAESVYNEARGKK